MGSSLGVTALAPSSSPAAPPAPPVRARLAAGAGSGCGGSPSGRGQAEAPHRQGSRAEGLKGSRAQGLKGNANGPTVKARASRPSPLPLPCSTLFPCSLLCALLVASPLGSLRSRPFLLFLELLLQCTCAILVSLAFSTRSPSPSVCPPPLSLSLSLSLFSASLRSRPFLLFLVLLRCTRPMLSLPSEISFSMCPLSLLSPLLSLSVSVSLSLSLSLPQYVARCGARHRPAEIGAAQTPSRFFPPKTLFCHSTSDAEEEEEEEEAEALSDEGKGKEEALGAKGRVRRRP